MAAKSDRLLTRILHERRKKSGERGGREFFPILVSKGPLAVGAMKSLHASTPVIPVNLLRHPRLRGNDGWGGVPHMWLTRPKSNMMFWSQSFSLSLMILW